MKCYNCGHTLPDDSEFCQYCGKRIETEISNQENTVEEDVSVVNEEIDDVLFSDDIDEEDFLQEFLKSTARETIKTMEENSQNQPNHEGESDFGIVEEKPIYTHALSSVDGEIEYLNRLYTDNGEKITWERFGSKGVSGINGMVDIYATYLPTGEPYKTIYVNMYGAKTSATAPAGFKFGEAVPVKLQDNHNKIKKPKMAKKDKTKYCSRCGYLINNETKVCSGCGKKYFKGIKLKKFPVTLFIMSIIILASVIINVVQLSKIDTLNDDVNYWKSDARNLESEIYELKQESSKNSRKLNFYENHVVIVADDGTKKYHKYGCDDLDTSSFWAYNTEAAEGRGYYACPKCH